MKYVVRLHENCLYKPWERSSNKLDIKVCIVFHQVPVSLCGKGKTILLQDVDCDYKSVQTSIRKSTTNVEAHHVWSLIDTLVFISIITIKYFFSILKTYIFIISHALEKCNWYFLAKDRNDGCFPEVSTVIARHNLLWL